MVQWVKNLPAVQETQEKRVQSLDQEDTLEEEMATCSSILAWRSPWMRTLVGHSSRGRKESDMTDDMCTHTTIYQSIFFFDAFQSELETWV